MSEMLKTEYETSPIEQHIAYRSPRLPLRFWRRVRQVPSGCWLWDGKFPKRGNPFVAQFKITRGPKVLSARYAYEALVSPLDRRTSLLRSCHEVTCINPAHREPVSAGEIGRRFCPFIIKNATKTKCEKGHAFSAANTRTDKRGQRICLLCLRERKRLGWINRKVLCLKLGICRKCSSKCAPGQTNCDRCISVNREQAKRSRTNRRHLA